MIFLGQKFNGAANKRIKNGWERARSRRFEHYEILLNITGYEAR
jgi:hypothetical protein